MFEYFRFIFRYGLKLSSFFVTLKASEMNLFVYKSSIFAEFCTFRKDILVLLSLLLPSTSMLFKYSFPETKLAKKLTMLETVKFDLNLGLVTFALIF